MKTNKPAGFWLRLLSRIIDLLIVVTVVSASAYLSMNKVNGEWHFKQSGSYYLWLVLSIVVMFYFTIAIPIITKGKSIGNLITRTRVVSKESLTKGILLRELFFGIAWVSILFVFLVVLTPEIFAGVMTNHKTNLDNTGLFRVGFVNTYAGIILFAQLMFGISILVKKGGNSLVDNFSKTNVIRENKFIEKPKEELKKKEIKPRLVKNNPVNWVEGE